MNQNALQLCRFILGLSWIYHGLVPKLLTVAPIESAMTGSLGLSSELSFVVTKVAGIVEVIFGLLLLIYYKSRLLLRISMLALLGLCLFVAVQVPSLLFEAFNPVTTNFALIGLSYVLLCNAGK